MDAWLGKLRKLRHGIACVGALIAVWHGQANGLTLDGAKIQEFDDRSELVLQFAEPLPGPSSMFRLSAPFRQILDLPVALDSEEVPLGLKGGERIRSAQVIRAGGRSRLVFEMAQSYEVSRMEGDKSITLVFAGPRPFMPTSQAAARLDEGSALTQVVQSTLGSTQPLASEAPVLQQWRVADSAGAPLIGLVFDRSEVQADARVERDVLRVRFARAKMAEGVPVGLKGEQGLLPQGARLEQGDQTLTLVVPLSGSTYQLRQTGGKVDIVLLPAVAQARPQTGNSQLAAASPYTGRPISLDFKDADIRTVMQVFADFTKMNLVVSDSVSGKVTVHLRDVPWDQALEIVMRSRGLVATRSGNVLLVSTSQDVQNANFDTASRKAQDDTEALVSRVFTVSYQKTEDLVATLKSEDARLMSARGTIISDERTSQIFLQDTVSRVERIATIIEGLDKPVKQVMIEAKVVLADTSVSRELGARVRVASNASEDFNAVREQLGQGTFADTGANAAATLAYTLFNANSTRLVNLQLRALESENRILTVSNPRVITSNKELASIEQGTEIPYQIATSSGATATEFKEANLKLAVTPQIAPDGTILLDVDIAKDSLGIVTVNGPAIDTRRVKTKVLVADGGTVVLGGIFEEDDNNLRQGVPGLSRLPGLGYLFKGTDKTSRRTELLIFLTPVVLDAS